MSERPAGVWFQLRGGAWRVALYGLLVAGAVSYLCMK